jgi:hypothetical protein
MQPLNWTPAYPDVLDKINKWGAKQEDPSETTKRLLRMAQGGGAALVKKKASADESYANPNATNYEQAHYRRSRSSNGASPSERKTRRRNGNAGAGNSRQGRHRGQAAPKGSDELDTPLQRKLARLDAAQELLEAPPRHARAAQEWRQGKDRLLGVGGYMNSRLTRQLDGKK